jgi:hypothetical protein
MADNNANVSLITRRQPSNSSSGDASAPSMGDTGVADAGVRPCLWCRRELTETQLRWCSKRCRQTAWRFRQLAVVEGLGDTPKRLAYADPPFPGLSLKYYRDEPSFAGEVDHRRLLEQLATFDGWALSTSRKALRDVLMLTASLVPGGDGPIVCPWVKTHHEPKSRGPANVHEYVLVVPARRRIPGVRDALVAAAARGNGNLPGRKPIEFAAWLFALLGAMPGDSLLDVFPGTGIIGSCWAEFCRSAAAATAASPMDGRDASPGAGTT